MLIFSAMLIVINVYCLYFWYDVEKNGELKHRLELMEQQRELTVQYYEDLEFSLSASMEQPINRLRRRFFIRCRCRRMCLG